MRKQGLVWERWSELFPGLDPLLPRIIGTLIFTFEHLLCETLFDLPLIKIQASPLPPVLKDVRNSLPLVFYS